MHKPRVSIIIPNYNHESYLTKRIESVLNQTYQNFELILLDDASTDGSKDLLKKYANHSKVSQTLYNKENSGSVFKQWIKGLQLAKGEYVWIAESDDYADTRFLEDTVALLEENEQLGMVFTDSFKVNAEDKELGMISKSKKHLQSLAKEGGIINTTNFTKYLLNKLVIVNASSVLFKKTALLELDFKVLKTLKNTGDVFTYVGIALRHNILFYPKPLNYMRLHDHNSTKKNKKNGQVYKDKIVLMDTYLEDFRKEKANQKPIINFFNGIVFLSIDYGHVEITKRLWKKLYQNQFISKKRYIKTNAVIFFYRNFMLHGRPMFVRQWLKSILNN